MTGGKFNLFFARFPFGGNECYESSNWYTETMIKCKADTRINDIWHMEYNDTPITMLRNRAVKDAKKKQADFIIMLDNDMVPDLDKRTPFWDTSWDFIINQYTRGPSMVAAPYCGPPPHENVYVFKWATLATDEHNMGMKLDQFTREETVGRKGFEEVAALPTGIIIIDMRVFGDLPGLDKHNQPCVFRMPHPYFDYQWNDKEETEKDTTEDVFFTRNASLLGIPCFVNWNAWAGHKKTKIVMRPWILTTEDIREEYAEAIDNSRRYQNQIYKLQVSKGKDFPPATNSEIHLSMPGVNGKIEPVHTAVS